MGTFLNYCKNNSSGKYVVEIFPFYRIKDYARIASAFFEEQANATGIVGTELPEVLTTCCTGIVVRDLAGTVVAVNAYASDSGLYSIRSYNPNILLGTSLEDTIDIICTARLPIDWVVPLETKGSFPDIDMKRYRVQTPPSMQDYVSALSKKQRTEYRKHTRRKLSFEEKTTQQVLDVITINEMSSRVSYSLGSSFPLIKERFKESLSDPDYYFLEVKEGGKVLGYNQVARKGNTIYDAAFIFTDDESLSARDGLYFSVIYGIINYAIANKIGIYDLGGACDYKKKFIPLTLDSSIVFSLFGVSNMVNALPDIYKDESFMSGFDFNKARLGVQQ